jgi:hypothetical protein
VSIGRAALEPLRAVEAGYAVVIQDTRGRFESEGSFDPFLSEASDGADTIAWIRAQGFSNGDIMMYGASYFGATQLLAAASAPSGLCAIAPSMTSPDCRSGWAYQGGAFQLGFALNWATSLARHELVRRRAAGEDVDALERSIEEVLRDPAAAYGRLPLHDHPTLLSLCPFYGEWLRRPAGDDYWRRLAIGERYQDIRVPALHIGGWADVFLEGTLECFRGLRELAGDVTARGGQRLIVGPWAHAISSEFVGEVNFGPAAAGSELDMTRLQLDFFDQVRSGSIEGPPVRLFVMGADRWRDEEAWPPPGPEPVRFHLHSNGEAGRDPEDGQLSPEPPDAAEPPDSYLYDPVDPVPTAGGATLMAGSAAGWLQGFRDQRRVEKRPDVLLYTTGVLARDLEVTGHVTLSLAAATSAADTDWTAKLVDVHPDGRAIGIVDGILRARHRSSLHQADFLEAGRPYRFEIALGATSMVFKAGHRLRLEVSSSNFPRFDRNPNSRIDVARARECDLRPAAQTVFHDSDRPSFLELPVRAGAPGSDRRRE